MNGVVTIEEARGLVSNRLLWPRVRDFLWNFAASVHPSWVEWKLGGVKGLDFGGAGGQSDGRAALPASGRIGKFILDSLGVEPCFHDFPKEDGSRLLLLDGSTLESIAMWLGALACASELRRITDGATVRALRTALPGVYPEVFGYAEYFRGLDGWKSASPDEAVGMPARVEEAGHALLLAAAENLQEPLRRRLALKLPRKFQPSSPPALQPSILPNIVKLLKLRFPEAYSLCCC